MTVTTSINSLLLTFGPPYATYNGLDLKSYRAYPAFFYGAFAYVLTALVKFLLLAILVPIFVSASANFDNGNTDHVVISLE